MFNLMTDSWVQAAGGSSCRYGLLELLRRAEQIEDLYENLALFEFGVHRLLTTIVQSLYLPAGPSDVRRLWQEGRFDPDRLAEFAEKYHSYFDLNRFFQAADAPEQETRQSKPASYLFPDIPVGSNPSILSHRHPGDNDANFCCFCLGHALCALPVWTTIGGMGLSAGINGTPPWYCQPVGRNLFETIVLSLFPVDGELTPLWESCLPIEKGRIERVDLLAGYTWPPRRVRLHLEPMLTPCIRCGGMTELAARRTIFQAGPKCVGAWRDPFVFWRKDRAVAPYGEMADWVWVADRLLEGNPDRKGTPTVELPQIVGGVQAAGLTPQSWRLVGLKSSQAKIMETIEVRDLQIKGEVHDADAQVPG